jgi:hypothetical protein
VSPALRNWVTCGGEKKLHGRYVLLGVEPLLDTKMVNLCKHKFKVVLTRESAPSEEVTKKRFPACILWDRLMNLLQGFVCLVIACFLNVFVSK